MRTALWFAALFCGAAVASSQGAKKVPPKAMLWSWYAEDDFRRVSDPQVGVAYLALSLTFAGRDDVTPSPRTIPIQIPPATYKMAVIRLDFSPEGRQRTAFSNTQRELAVRMIGEIATLGRPQAVQIDFDAPRSAWPFYRSLLSELRERLGPDVFLSITALVSWCDTPRSWMSGLPVDEMVPMAFSMGQATPATGTLLESGGQFAFPGCRTSIGVAFPTGVYDVPVRPRKNQRGYFSPGSNQWSPEAVSEARKAFLP